jgi:hypothetical protein
MWEALVAAIMKGLAAAGFEWAQKQAEKPKVLELADTPPEKLAAYQDRIEEFKHEKDAAEKTDQP